MAKPTAKASGALQSIKSFNENTANLTEKDLKSEARRFEILRKARSVIEELTPSRDFVLAQAMSMNLNLCVRLCIELRIFKLLYDSESPLSLKRIAEEVGAEELLVLRLMRAVCALGFVTESDTWMWKANNVTKDIVSPPLEAAFSLCFDTAVQPKSNLSEHLRFFSSNGYKCPVSATDAPYQHANECVGMTAFEHWAQDPVESLRFYTFTHGVQNSRLCWWLWFPVEKQLLDGAQEEVLIVDIGGGHGHDLEEFNSRFPKAPGKLVLQDLPSVIDEMGKEIGDALDVIITRQKHDFFTPQPVKGARLYFMHSVIHEWLDEDARKVLSHIRDAMSQNSRIYIHDMILPDEDVPLISAAFDITMMAHHCGVERSEQMWRDLVDGVEGLEIVQFWKPPQAAEGIIELRRS